MSNRLFKIEESLGKGGFGDVFRATMSDASGHSETVAIKVIRTGRMLDEGSLKRMRDEARVLSLLEHRSILRFIDLVYLGERLCLVTEFVDGLDLSDLWALDGFGIKHGLEIASCVAEALDSALQTEGGEGQALGLVHRDVKPRNIRVNTSGEVKLLDFGIVLFQGTDREASTETGTVLGSSQYMAPEQLLSSRCTSKADIFALGAILYEACARKRLLTKQIRLLMLQGAGNPLSFRIYVKRQLVHIPDITGLHELLVEMLEMDESIRPTASEVGLRCREIAKSLEGEGLREWCQTRRWSQPEPIPNPWLGLELSEKGVVDVRVKRKTKLLERPAVASTLPEVEQKLVVARKSIIQLITLIVLGLSVFGFWIFFVYK